MPEVVEDDALIHGRVVDEADRGTAGLMVCLVDHNGKSITGLADAITDVSGYFAIALDAKLIDSRTPRRKKKFLKVLRSTLQ